MAGIVLWLVDVASCLIAEHTCTCSSGQLPEMTGVQSRMHALDSDVRCPTKVSIQSIKHFFQKGIAERVSNNHNTDCYHSGVHHFGCVVVIIFTSSRSPISAGATRRCL